MRVTVPAAPEDETAKAIAPDMSVPTTTSRTTSAARRRRMRDMGNSPLFELPGDSPRLATDDQASPGTGRVYDHDRRANPALMPRLPRAECHGKREPYRFSPPVRRVPSTSGRRLGGRHVCAPLRIKLSLCGYP